jgi:hypothetical protein
MQARLKLKPGQKGTKKLVEQYGSRLVCVRYRYDAQTKKRYKTVEIIVDEVAWTPRPPKASGLVDLEIAWRESDLAQLVQAAGGRWSPEKRLWELSEVKARELGLEGLIRSSSVSDSRNRTSGSANKKVSDTGNR